MNTETKSLQETRTGNQPAAVYGPGDWFPGDTLAGEFIVRAPLGQGGMGTVYLVERIADRALFAVKRLPAGFRSDASRSRQLFNELKTWIDLPDSKHVVKCKFFKTIDSRLALFAEYVSGGSLSNWIRSGRCSTTGIILDLAIQFAWGLQLAHSCGIAHGDVKPANALVDGEGTLKVTDFGLARSFNAGPFQQVPGTAGRVPAWGFTAAYCSPEQLTGERVTFKSDLWSWGIVLVEMFCGRLEWRLGAAASYALDHDDRIESKMPADVFRVIRRCLKENPEDRWSSMVEAAEALIHYCNRHVAPFERIRPEFPLHADPAPVNLDRLTTDGLNWADPNHWLALAREATGRPPPDPRESIDDPGTTRVAQAISDLKRYDEAAGIYSELIAQGRSDCVNDYLALLHKKALLHSVLNDLPGAIQTCEESIRLAQSLATGTRSYPGSLIGSLEKKASFLIQSGDPVRSLEVCDYCIDLLESDRTGDIDTWVHLANALTNRGNALMALNRFSEAAAANEKAILILQDHKQRMAPVEYLRLLSIAIQNHGVTCSRQGDYEKALEDQDQVLALRLKLVNDHGCLNIRNTLAASYNNKGSILKYLSRFEESAECYREAIRIREDLVLKEGRSDLESHLALAYLNLGWLEFEMDRLASAGELVSKSTALLKKALFEEDRQHLQNFYETSVILSAKVHIKLEQYQPAREELSELRGSIASRASHHPEQSNMDRLAEIDSLLHSMPPPAENGNTMD